jgi:hypothetical protein
MDYFVIFVLGMATSLLILRWTIRRAIDQIMSRLAQEDAVQDNNVKLKLEFDQNTYFTYNTANDQFVCQGSSVQQLKERLTEMFPKQTTFTIVDGDPAVLATVKQELEHSK